MLLSMFIREKQRAKNKFPTQCKAPQNNENFQETNQIQLLIIKLLLSFTSDSSEKAYCLKFVAFWAQKLN